MAAGPWTFEGTLVRRSNPSTSYLRFLLPKTILPMVFGTKDPKNWVLGPSGLASCLLVWSPRGLRSRGAWEAISPRRSKGGVPMISALGTVIIAAKVYLFITWVLGPQQKADTREPLCPLFVGFQNSRRQGAFGCQAAPKTSLRNQCSICQRAGAEAVDMSCFIMGFRNLIAGFCSKLGCLLGCP